MISMELLDLYRNIPPPLCPPIEHLLIEEVNISSPLYFNDDFYNKINLTGKNKALC